MPQVFAAPNRLTQENVQRPQAALFELDECRRILEAARGA